MCTNTLTPRASAANGPTASDRTIVPGRKLLCLMLLALPVAMACRDEYATPTGIGGPLYSVGSDGYDLGFSFYDCTIGLTTDADSDGLDDTCENDLALAFNPLLVRHNNEIDASREAAYAVKRTAGSVTIIYLMAYHRDNGTLHWLGFEPAVLGPHTGDSEFVVLHVTETGGRWLLDNAFMSAHYKAKFLWMNFDESGLYTYSQLSYPDQYRGRPHVWIAKNKHANYPSGFACNATNDECALTPYAGNTTPAVQFSSRNIGSGLNAFIDSIGTVWPGGSNYYTGIEAFWSPVDDFNGWMSYEQGSRPIPYHQVLKTWGFFAGYDSTFTLGYISGPTAIHPSTYCNWTVAASGGTTPYKYWWYKGDDLVSTYSNYSGPAGNEDFLLSVVVHDRYGYRGQRYTAVAVDGEYPDCVE